MAPSRFSGKFALGPTARGLFGIPFYGGDFHLSIGARPLVQAAFYWDLGVFLGATDFGLYTVHVRPGFLAEGVFGPFRVGGEFELGWLSIHRITSDGAMWAFTLGPRILGSVDLVRLGRRAVAFVGLAAGAAFLPFSDSGANHHLTPVMLEGELQLGVRFEPG